MRGRITHWTSTFLIAKLKLDQSLNLSQFGNFKNNELIIPEKFKMIIYPSLGELMVVATHKELQENEALFQLIF